MTEDCWHDELVKELYEVLDKWIDEKAGFTGSTAATAPDSTDHNAAEVMNTVIHTLAESIYRGAPSPSIATGMWLSAMNYGNNIILTLECKEEGIDPAIYGLVDDEDEPSPESGGDNVVPFDPKGVT